MSSQDRIIAGRNPVRETLERGDAYIEKIMIQQGAGGRPVEQIVRMARKRNVPVQYVPSARLLQMAGGLNHQGVVALSTPVGYQDFDEMLNGIAPRTDDVRAKKPVLLLLDQIEDPHNFGAILRSTVAFGVDGVIVPKHNMAPLSATAIKASSGAALRIPIARVTNLAESIEQLKERGYWVAGAVKEGSLELSNVDWDRPIAIVIGSEGHGIRPRVVEMCDYQVSIPMIGPMESLNASVAAGIILYAVVQARNASGEKTRTP